MAITPKGKRNERKAMKLTEQPRPRAKLEAAGEPIIVRGQTYQGFYCGDEYWEHCLDTDKWYRRDDED